VIRSLRLRLILFLGAAIVVATVVQFTTSFQSAMGEANKLSDYHMQQMALALQDGGFEQAAWYPSHDATHHGFDFVVQIWADDVARVFQSRPYRILPKQGALGFYTVTLANGDWRVYTARTPMRTIQIAQKLSTRRDRAISLAVNSLWSVLPVSLLLWGVAWWVISTAISPLNRIGRDLANRNVDSLAPVSDAGAPQEVARLVAELNLLLARMRQALQSQRQFVADAAHELRSPITALKLQAHTLARASDETARIQGLGRLLGGVDRAARLVEQLLVLAREEPLSLETEPVAMSLPGTISQALSDVAPFAHSRHIECQCGPLTQAQILGDADSLRVMIRNLLDNAVRYTPEHGMVRVDLVADDAAVVLSLQDSGAGIPAPDRARVFDRFYRVQGTSPSGSGLGLAIVKAIAERHAATVTLSDAALGGLAVAVAFPRASFDSSGMSPPPDSSS
jgi:two-component system OmpR family sensor kinase